MGFSGLFKFCADTGPKSVWKNMIEVCLPAMPAIELKVCVLKCPFSLKQRYMGGSLLSHGKFKGLGTKRLMKQQFHTNASQDLSKQFEGSAQ